MRIAIVDDKAYLRQSLRDKLQAARNGMDIIFEAADGTGFLEQMKSARDKPDVVLMDIEMGEMGGIETVQVASALYPDIKFLMLTVFDDDEKIFNAIKSGAHGYLLKEESADVLLSAIQEVYQEEGAPMSPGIARKAWKWLTSLSGRPAAEDKQEEPAGSALLSEREKEILRCCMEGKEYAQIAAVLYLSRHTVRQHMKNIYKKLHVSSKVEALQVSLKNKWI